MLYLLQVYALVVVAVLLPVLILYLVLIGSRFAWTTVRRLAMRIHLARVKRNEAVHHEEPAVS